MNNKPTRFYSWQGEQLLGVVDTKSGKQLACLTDGNKNVVGLLDGSGEVSAKYAYSPFGKLISAKGADAKRCDFGFSSEYRDNESGLVYYNYRYLNPKLGRWMSRDPIGALGGDNLYGIVNNQIIYKVDIIGLGPGTISCTFVALFSDTGWLYASIAPSGFQGGGAESGGTSTGFSIFYVRTIIDQYACNCCIPSVPTTKYRIRQFMHQVNIQHALQWNAGIPGTWPPLDRWDWITTIIGGTINPPTIAGPPEEVSFVANSIINQKPNNSINPAPSEDTGVPTMWCIWK